MKRLVPLVLCVLLVAAACGGTSSAAAAHVNGAAITNQELVDELNAILANTDYINSLQSGPSGGFTVLGSTPGSFDAAFVSQVLVRQMSYVLIDSEVRTRKLAISDACKLQARDDVLLNLGNNDSKAGQALLDKFPKPYQDLLVRRNTELLALEATLGGQTCGTGFDAQSYYDAHPDQFTKYCISIIALNDAGPADTIVTQARNGTDFGALVRQYSVDPETKAANGDSGCHLLSDLNASVAGFFTSAKAGDVLDPIPSSSGGATIVKITDKQLAPIDEVRVDAERAARGAAGQAFNQWLQDAQSKARVTIDPRYGTWDPSRFQISEPTIDQSSSSGPTTSSSSANP